VGFTAQVKTPPLLALELVLTRCNIEEPAAVRPHQRSYGERRFISAVCRFIPAAAAVTVEELGDFIGRRASALRPVALQVVYLKGKL
jgi:hypothetical protein